MKILLPFLIIIGATAAIWTYTSCCSWDKTFKKSNKVDVRKVSFNNRYGIKLVGDYIHPKTKPPKNFRHWPYPARLAQSRNNLPDFMPKPWPNVVL